MGKGEKLGVICEGEERDEEELKSKYLQKIWKSFQIKLVFMGTAIKMGFDMWPVLLVYHFVYCVTGYIYHC